MSEEQNQQAVVEKTDAGAQPPAEGADARATGDDLDSLLSQFDATATPKTEPKPAPEQAKGAAQIDPDKIAEQVRASIDAETRLKADITSTVKTIRGELDPEVFDDAFVESWLDTQARNDPRLAQAWRDRHAKPAEFRRVAEQLGKKLAGKFSKLPDKSATEDREAVTEAIVRGSQQTAPERKPADFSKQNNREFADQVEKDFGFRPI